MKVLLTGACGQLGAAFKNIFLENNIDCVALSKSEMDISNANKVFSMLSDIKPHIIINTAAYTNVDLSEKNSKKAFLINSDGPFIIAKTCAELDIFLVHFSTDYVFDGNKKTAYIPGDPTNPLNEYGRSKLAGEIKIQENCSNYIILRSSGLFSQYKKNFLRTMLDLSNSEKELNIVSDQFCTPTFACDIAIAITSILPRIINKDFMSGIFHFAGDQTLSWDEFSLEIFTQAQKMGMIKHLPSIKKVSSKEYNSIASRPFFSALNSSNFLNEFNIAPSNTLKSIGRALAALNNT